MNYSTIFTEQQERAILGMIDERISSGTETKSDLVPVVQWANENSISVSKLYRLREAGQLRFHKFGKNSFLKRSEVESLIQPE